MPAVWQAIDELGGGELLKKVLKRVGRLLADHYCVRITATDPKERLQQLVKLLETEAALLELGRNNGRLVIRRRSCPFINMSDDKRTVCAIDLDLMSAVAGRQVRRIASRQDGSPSCIFEVEREALAMAETGRLIRNASRDVCPPGDRKQLVGFLALPALGASAAESSPIHLHRACRRRRYSTRRLDWAVAGSALKHGSYVT